MTQHNSNINQNSYKSSKSLKKALEVETKFCSNQSVLKNTTFISDIKKTNPRAFILRDFKLFKDNLSPNLKLGLQNYRVYCKVIVS